MLHVASRAARNTVMGMTDVERRERLAFAIRTAMAGRTAQEISDAIEPRRSKETIARWARGETVPSALDVGPLATALGVRIELLVSPPAVPSYPLSEYLVDVAIAEGVEVGKRRARQPQAGEAPAGPQRSRRPPVRSTGREQR